MPGFAIVPGFAAMPGSAVMPGFAAMNDTDFETALVTAAFRIAGERGWGAVNVVAAAREAGLSLPEARAQFPSRGAILLRFGRLADQAALSGASTDGSVRDRLFDLLMRRFDVMQRHRAGVKAVLRFLPTHPPAALLLACATRRSMRWMLHAAGVGATGPRGALQVRGLVAVWLWGVRAWERDESEDLSATMAAVDAALKRAEQVASWLHGAREASDEPESSVSPQDQPSTDDPPTDDPPPDDPSSPASGIA
jgi:ubiquinone biosynthesis protein COQ9